MCFRVLELSKQVTSSSDDTGAHLINSCARGLTCEDIQCETRDDRLDLNVYAERGTG